MAIPTLWRTTKERYSLQGDKCPDCSRMVFPPRRLCPYCGCKSSERTAEKSHFEFTFVMPTNVMPTNVEYRTAGDD